MGRPTLFNRDNALQAAMSIFWEKGYSDTSMQNLVIGLGMQRGSLYAEFGDKKHLYIAALDHYQANIILPAIQALIEHPVPLDAITEFLERTFLMLPDQLLKTGCFAVNSVVELRGADDDLADFGAKQLDYIQAGLVKAIKRIFDTEEGGQQLRSLGADAAAQTIIHLIIGMRVACKKAVVKPALLLSINTLLTLFELKTVVVSLETKPIETN